MSLLDFACFWMSMQPSYREALASCAVHNTLADKSIAVIPCGWLKCLSVHIRGCFRFQSDTDGVLCVCVCVSKYVRMRQKRSKSAHWVAVCSSDRSTVAALTEEQMC